MNLSVLHLVTLVNYKMLLKKKSKNHISEISIIFVFMCKRELISVWVKDVEWMKVEFTEKSKVKIRKSLIFKENIYNNSF